MTKAVAYLTQLAETRKLLAFAKEFKLSYVYVWQLKTPKTDSRGKPLRDGETGRVIYRRSPSFKIINKLKSVIPTEYWYEEEPQPLRERPATAQARARVRSDEGAQVSSAYQYLEDDPFSGVLPAWGCDPELADRSLRFPRPLAKILLDF